MANKKIVNYIQKAIEKGHTEEQIRVVLSENGWSSAEISEAILKAQEIIQKKETAPPLSPPKKSNWNIEINTLSVSQILLYLGGLIVLVAAVIYIGINWSEWTAVGRIFAFLLPMLICYGFGIPMFFKKEYERQGAVFLFVGSLLFPIFLSITFQELKLFAKPFNDNFNLMVSSLSFILYFISSFIFRPLPWYLLYQGFGVFIYYFVLKIIGIESLGSSSLTMAWLLLIPGTIYLFLSLFYHKKKKETEGHCLFSIGIFVIFLSFFNLFAKLFLDIEDEHFFWPLLLLAIMYFLLGIFYEKKYLKKYSKALYFMGTIAMSLSFFGLSMNGTLIKDFTGNLFSHLEPRTLSLWSIIVVGIIYCFIGYFIEKLKAFRLKEASEYKLFFNSAGPFCIVGAIFFLGFDGSEPFYETMLLLLSLGLIFGSVFRQVEQYLLIGTLFLIIYIFSIGIEYFQDEVGWPMMLFAAGLTSMGISIVIEKVRKKYFITDRI
jgi:hypothetical protein